MMSWVLQHWLHSMKIWIRKILRSFQQRDTFFRNSGVSSRLRSSENFYRKILSTENRNLKKFQQISILARKRKKSLPLSIKTMKTKAPFSKRMKSPKEIFTFNCLEPTASFHLVTRCKVSLKYSTTYLSKKNHRYAKNTILLR